MMWNASSVDEGLETIRFDILELMCVTQQPGFVPRGQEKFHLCNGRNNASLSWQNPSNLCSNVTVGLCTLSVLSALTTDPGWNLVFIPNEGKLECVKGSGRKLLPPVLVSSSAGDTAVLLRALLMRRTESKMLLLSANTADTPSCPFVTTIVTTP